MHISCLLPVKNGSEWIETNLPRIQSNLGSRDELIIIDDHSVDTSLRLLAQFAKTDPRIQIITSKGKGLVAALDSGIEQCSHDWIARFDIDDKYPSNRLNLQRESLADGVAACFTDYKILWNGKLRVGTIPSPLSSAATSLSLFRSQRTAHPSVLFNKTAYFESGGYREEDFPMEDLSLWFRMSYVGSLISIAHTGLYYNMRSHSISAKNRHHILRMKNHFLRKTNYENIVQTAFSNLEQTFFDYQESNLGGTRQLLHLSDFFAENAWNYLGEVQKKKIRSELIRCGKSKTLLKETVPILGTSFLRRILRQLQR